MLCVESGTPIGAWVREELSLKCKIGGDDSTPLLRSLSSSLSYLSLIDCSLLDCRGHGTPAPVLSVPPQLDPGLVIQLIRSISQALNRGPEFACK